MSIPVVLSLRGVQSYPGSEPETVELVTDGKLTQLGNNSWSVSYDESSLTGMEGVTTTFTLMHDTVTLTRSGALSSEMVFREGIGHDSLYQLDFGALMIRVCASRVQWSLSPRGGVVELKYQIQIEHGDAGTVDYHLDIQAK